jgi:hypothetical protein
MTKLIDPLYHVQDSDSQAWLNRFFQVPKILHYHFINESEWCLTFDADIVDDERPLFQWIMDHGGMPIVDPKNHYWYGKGVFWFPNSRSRHYALLTAEEYIESDQWWKHTFDTEEC